MRISDWSSDVCSSDLQTAVDRRLDIFGIHRLRPRNCARQSGLREGTGAAADQRTETVSRTHRAHSSNLATWPAPPPPRPRHQPVAEPRSEEHTSELQSLMRISYAVFCLKKKIQH